MVLMSAFNFFDYETYIKYNFQVLWWQVPPLIYFLLKTTCLNLRLYFSFLLQCGPNILCQTV